MYESTVNGEPPRSWGDLKAYALLEGPLVDSAGEAPMLEELTFADFSSKLKAFQTAQVVSMVHCYDVEC